jgi:hypothetical protein
LAAGEAGCYWDNRGASCPDNLIEETLLRLFELRGITRAQLEAAAVA